MGLPLAKIEAYAGALLRGRHPGVLEGEARFCIDSRKLRAGEVFVAIRGPHHDAHRFIDTALRERAALSIVGRDWYEAKRPKTGLFLPVDDTILALLRMAKAHLAALPVKIVAVTGSNGKTTTRAMIAAVLRRRCRVFETEGNFNNRIGLPLSVFRIGRGHEIAVLEMGTNHFGEIDELSRAVPPDLAVITNIGRSHLEFLRDRRGVLRAKMEIVAGMRPGGSLLVNGDDDLLLAVRPPAGIRKIIARFGRPAYLSGSRCETGLLTGTAFLAGGKARVRLPVPGEGAAVDALLALAVGKFFGVPLSEGASALARVEIPGERMKIMKIRGASVVSDCYNANPDSLMNALSLLGREKVKGRKVAVLGGMGELGKGSARFHEEAGAAVAEQGFDVLLALGEPGRAMARGALRKGLRAVHVFDDRDHMAKIIRASIRPGDALLVKGSHSTGMERVVEQLKGGRS